MIESESYNRLKEEITDRIKQDRVLLDQLRSEIQVLRNSVRRIQPRNTTSISLVGTDGGNNRIQYDPFLVQLIRVVDSSNNEYCLEAITPTTDIVQLSSKQFNSDGSPRTALGEMMEYLGVKQFSRLSMISVDSGGTAINPSWVQVYREIVEWAILFSIVRTKQFGTDTLIVFDGLLRSKVFAGELFKKLRQGIDDAIQMHFTRSRRKIYIVGFAKHSKVLARYRLAMALEGILAADYPAYAEIPRELERKSYLWKEYAREDEEEGEANKFVGGKLFFAKFGSRSQDPIWPVDILVSQSKDAQVVMGCLLSDSLNGFPIPFYPLCLQKAHENAALSDFDYDILQDQIMGGIRNVLGNEAQVLEASRLQNQDPARARYS